MSQNSEIRKQLGPIPAGENNLAEYRMTVKRAVPWEWTVSRLATFGADTLRYQVTEQMEKAMGGDASRPNNGG